METNSWRPHEDREDEHHHIHLIPQSRLLKLLPKTPISSPFHNKENFSAKQTPINVYVPKPLAPHNNNNSRVVHSSEILFTIEDQKRIAREIFEADERRSKLVVAALERRAARLTLSAFFYSWHLAAKKMRQPRTALPVSTAESVASDFLVQKAFASGLVSWIAAMKCKVFRRAGVPAMVTEHLQESSLSACIQIIGLSLQSHRCRKNTLDKCRLIRAWSEWSAQTCWLRYAQEKGFKKKIQNMKSKRSRIIQQKYLDKLWEYTNYKRSRKSSMTVENRNALRKSAISVLYRWSKHVSNQLSQRLAIVRCVRHQRKKWLKIEVFREWNRIVIKHISIVKLCFRSISKIRKNAFFAWVFLIHGNKTQRRARNSIANFRKKTSHIRSVRIFFLWKKKAQMFHQKRRMLRKWISQVVAKVAFRSWKKNVDLIKRAKIAATTSAASEHRNQLLLSSIRNLELEVASLNASLAREQQQRAEGEAIICEVKSQNVHAQTVLKQQSSLIQQLREREQESQKAMLQLKIELQGTVAERAAAVEAAAAANSKLRSILMCEEQRNAKLEGDIESRVHDKLLKKLRARDDYIKNLSAAVAKLENEVEIERARAAGCIAELKNLRDTIAQRRPGSLKPSWMP